MKDLTGINYTSYIRSHPYYYQVDSFFEISPDDYYCTLVQGIGGTTHHTVIGKFPWTYIHFPRSSQIDSGWKIHISATIANHIHILSTVAKYAFQKKIPFKFASNLSHFIHLNSKNIARSSSGKFIVLYPPQADFKQVIEDLYNLLDGFDGPYILSDKQYRDSKVVFYRYGEINPISFVDPYGMITTRILSPNNTLEIDKRLPYFSLPTWVEPIFPDEQGNTQSNLLQKYKIDECLHFSAQGGVYLGTFKNEQFVIKEARAWTGISSDQRPAPDRLKSEYKMLKMLEDTGTVPAPLELMEDGGNLYLVEEYLKGETLHSYPHMYSPYVQRKKDVQEQEKQEKEFSEEYLTIISLLLENISKVHSCGVAFGDLSPSNIIFSRDSKQLKLIDLETAYLISKSDSAHTVTLETPGFFLQDNTVHTPHENDLYKVGLIMMYCIEPYNAIFDMDNANVLHILSLFYSSTTIPRYILDVVYGLVTFQYSSAMEAKAQLISPHGKKSNSVLNISVPPIDHNQILNSISKNISEFINGESSLACDPMGFLTSQYCLSYGLFGMLYGLKKADLHMSNSNDAAVHKFMYDFYESSNSMTGGLFVGLSGIAYALLALGYIPESRTVLAAARTVDMDMCDYAYGRAGRLATYLYFYSVLGDEQYLSNAIDDAEYIIDHTKQFDGQNVWMDSEGDVYSGLTRGGAGIALVLLQLYLVSNEPRYLLEGKKALAGDLAKLTITDNGFIGLNSIPRNSPGKVYSPYIHSGLAGLGCVLVRYYAVTKDAKYVSTIQEIIAACTNNMVLHSGYLRGVTGILSFYQDCIFYLDNVDAKELCNHLIKLLPYHYVECNGYAGFAGEQLYRISHDFFTGSAGVLAGLKRSQDKACVNPFLVADEIFTMWKCT